MAGPASRLPNLVWMLFPLVVVWMASLPGSALAAGGGSKVVVLTDDDFDYTIRKHERVLVKFFAPWCGHCQKLAPEYEQAAKDVHAAGGKTIMAELDASKDPKLAKQYGVSGYPTMLYFVKGKPGPEFPSDPAYRKADKLAEWVKGLELRPYLTEKEVDKFVKKLKPGEFGLLAQVKDGSARAKVFWNAVDVELRKDPNFKFKCAGVKMAKEADGNRGAVLTLWRPHFEAPEAKSVQFKGTWSENDIVRWARKRAYPAIDVGYQVRKHSWPVLQGAGWEGLVVALVPGENLTDAGRGEVSDILKPFVKEHPAWRFTIAAAGSLSVNHRWSIGLRGPAGPALVVVQRRFFVLEGAEVLLGASTVREFLDKVKAGRAKPTFKSEPPPSAAEQDGVAVLTGDSFERVALDPQRDVLVLFTAPDCQACREDVEPVLAQLARKAAESGWRELGFVVGRFDGSRNDCQEEVIGYPKLVLYPAVEAEKKMEHRRTFSGRYSLDSVAAFVLLHARNLAGARREL